MMMLALALIISCAAGLTVGLQINHIIGGLRAAIDVLRASQADVRKKNTGVVRPGLNTQPVPSPEATRRSAVVRPRIPQEADPDETGAALASVRERTAPR